MDSDNLEHLMTLAGLLERFKERLATKRDTKVVELDTAGHQSDQDLQCVHVEQDVREESGENKLESGLSDPERGASENRPTETSSYELSPRSVNDLKIQKPRPSMEPDRQLAISRSHLVEEFGDATAGLSEHPDVLKKMLTRMIDYVRVDLDNLLDELLSNTQQTEMPLERDTLQAARIEQSTELQEKKLDGQINNKDEMERLQVELIQQSTELQEKKLDAESNNKDEMERLQVELIRREELARDQEVNIMLLEEKIRMLLIEGETQDDKIARLHEEKTSLSNSLVNTEALVGNLRRQVTDAAAEKELERKHQAELKTENEKLSKELESAKTLTEVIQLRAELDRRATECKDLTETCKHLQEKVRTLENKDKLGLELIKLRNQFQDFRTETKATDNKLVETALDSQKHETAFREKVNPKIHEIQEALTASKQTLGLANEEQRIEKSTTSLEEYSLQVSKLYYDSVTQLIQNHQFNTSIVVDRLDQSQKENVQLSARLEALAALSLDLTSKLTDMKKGVNQQSTCYQFLLGSCCP